MSGSYQFPLIFPGQGQGVLFACTILRLAGVRGHAPQLAGMCDGRSQLRGAAAREGGRSAAGEPVGLWKEELVCGWKELCKDVRRREHTQVLSLPSLHTDWSCSSYLPSWRLLLAPRLSRPARSPLLQPTQVAGTCWNTYTRHLCSIL